LTIGQPSDFYSQNTIKQVHPKDLPLFGGRTDILPDFSLQGGMNSPSEPAPVRGRMLSYRRHSHFVIPAIPVVAGMTGLSRSFMTIE